MVKLTKKIVAEWVASCNVDKLTDVVEARNSIGNLCQLCVTDTEAVAVESVFGVPIPLALSVKIWIEVKKRLESGVPLPAERPFTV